MRTTPAFPLIFKRMSPGIICGYSIIGNKPVKRWVKKATSSPHPRNKKKRPPAHIVSSQIIEAGIFKLGKLEVSKYMARVIRI